MGAHDEIFFFFFFQKRSSTVFIVHHPLPAPTSAIVSVSAEITMHLHRPKPNRQNENYGGVCLESSATSRRGDVAGNICMSWRQELLYLPFGKYTVLVGHKYGCLKWRFTNVSVLQPSGPLTLKGNAKMPASFVPYTFVMTVLTNVRFLSLLPPLPPSTSLLSP